MKPHDYPIVAEFKNDTLAEMRLSLEMLCEEVILSPGQEIELLARPSANLLPLTVHQIEGGLQVFPCREFDPDWYIRFKGKLLKPGFPTRLAEFE